ncbi:DUF4158 domain-containing protein [Streptomyces sp. NPDC000927]|uniref:DUF4158 domain-containing protein n=1 Tax=Streptomyces sp. NPDC000927 TaxID=3154371 RepID=UPI00332B1A7D
MESRGAADDAPSGQTLSVTALAQAIGLVRGFGGRSSIAAGQGYRLPHAGGVLTDEQAEAYGTFTEVPTRPELERFFFLDDDDRGLIALRRTDAHRLGMVSTLPADRDEAVCALCRNAAYCE